MNIFYYKVDWYDETKITSTGIILAETYEQAMRYLTETYGEESIVDARIAYLDEAYGNIIELPDIVTAQIVKALAGDQV